MEAEIKYINSCGFECTAVIYNPDQVHHVWYSSKRNSMGKYDRNEVTVLAHFLSKLKDCKLVGIRVYGNR